MTEPAIPKTVVALFSPVADGELAWTARNYERVCIADGELAAAHESEALCVGSFLCRRDPEVSPVEELPPLAHKVFEEDARQWRRPAGLGEEDAAEILSAYRRFLDRSSPSAVGGYALTHMYPSKPAAAEPDPEPLDLKLLADWIAVMGPEGEGLLRAFIRLIGAMMRAPSAPPEWRAVLARRAADPRPLAAPLLADRAAEGGWTRVEGGWAKEEGDVRCFVPDPPRPPS